MPRDTHLYVREWILKPLLISLFIFLHLAAASSAENRSCPHVPDEYKPGRILGFTRHLVKQGEYYNAYTELQRLESYYPNYVTPEQYKVTEKYLLFRGGQYNSILGIKAVTGSPVLNAAGSLFRYDSLFRLSEYENARKQIKVIPADSPAHTALFFYKRRILADIILNDFNDIRKTYADFSGYGFPSYDDIIDYSEKRMSELKSPVTAMALGIVPGMGYAYAGNTGTGVVALLVVTVNTLLTVFALRSGNEEIAVITGTVGTLFYSGSIIGGYMAASRQNRQLMGSLADFAGDYFELAKDREIMYTRYGIGNGR